MQHTSSHTHFPTSRRPPATSLTTCPLLESGIRLQAGIVGLIVVWMKCIVLIPPINLSYNSRPFLPPNSSDTLSVLPSKELIPTFLPSFPLSLTILVHIPLCLGMASFLRFPSVDRPPTQQSASPSLALGPHAPPRKQHFS